MIWSIFFELIHSFSPIITIKFSSKNESTAYESVNRFLIPFFVPHVSLFSPFLLPSLAPNYITTHSVIIHSNPMSHSQPHPQLK